MMSLSHRFFHTEVILNELLTEPVELNLTCPLRFSDWFALHGSHLSLMVLMVICRDVILLQPCSTRSSPSHLFVHA